MKVRVIVATLGERESLENCFRSIKNQELLDLLIRAASDNNEFDNRRELEYYRTEVLQRMKNERKKKA